MSSSDLNRRSGEVLRYALDRPVTITRADGDLVLMRRSLAASLTRATSAWPDVVSALVRVVAVASGESVDATLVARLELDDLTALGTELADAVLNRQKTEDALQEASAILYEWAATMSWTMDPEAKRKVDAAERAIRGRRTVSAGPERSVGRQQDSGTREG